MAIYVPVFKMAVSYSVSFGRRWSLLEHLMLIELTTARSSVAHLAAATSLPERLIIEGLINLLRFGWIEVRSTDAGVQFWATNAGRRRATDETLPLELQRKVKWISLCADRLTGAWMRADDLQLVHEKDLPESATALDPLLSTYDTNDGTVRDLVYLEPDESFESFQPTFRNSTRLFARFELAFDQIQGLPKYAPVRLERAIKEAPPTASSPEEETSAMITPPVNEETPLDTILRTVTEIEQILDRLPSTVRPRVRLSPMSSGSHAKVLLYDNARTGEWEAVVGSCNFLSTIFDAIEISERSRSQRIAMQLLGRLIAAQQPASGGWSPVARRLARIWDELRRRVRVRSEIGSHALRLVADEDHYACVTTARDEARRSIIIGCDLYGVAAETSVLVPMTRAAELGRQVRLFYRRPSRFIAQEGRVPNADEVKLRGYSLEQIQNLHGKFLTWDDESLVVTSFNWLSTVVANTRARGAELGIMSSGPDLREILAKKLMVASGGSIDIARDRELNLFSLSNSAIG